MVKRIICFLIAAVAAMQLCTAYASLNLEYDGESHVYTGEVYTLIVNGQTITSAVPPIIFNDRALVPVREVCETYGAVVDYIDETREIDVTKDGTVIRMFINDNTVYVNGKKQLIPDGLVPKLINQTGGEGKTMIPVRFVSETLGMDIDFSEETGTITITSPDYDPSSAPTSAPTAAPTGGTAVTANGITAETVSSTLTRVTISSSLSEIEYTDFTMSDPERIIIDVKSDGFISGLSDTDINLNGISRVRFGTHTSYSRVVIDLDFSERGYSVTSDGGKLIVDITTSAASAATAAPADTTNTQQDTAQSTQQETQATPTPAASEEKLIVLDAGHGGMDPGAQSTYNGETINEKDITLAIMLKTQAILQNNGYRVEVTRSGDTYPTLTERAELANSLNAAVFVSIHINSNENSDPYGAEVYYAESNNGDSYGAKSSELAKNILDCMMKHISTKNRGVKTAEHVVTKTSVMPAVLVEVGFISNPDELVNLLDDSYQTEAAQGIAEGIIMTLESITVPTE